MGTNHFSLFSSILNGRVLLNYHAPIKGARFIPPILYYKVYNSSCSQVEHDLIDRVKSSPEQIKIQFLFASTFYMMMEVLDALA